MPFFPVYNGQPASMAFVTVNNVLAIYAGTICSVNITTDVPGRIAIWGNIDATLTCSTQLWLDNAVLTQSTYSPYIFYGSANAIPAGTYTVSLVSVNYTEVPITTASLMAIGLLT